MIAYEIPAAASPHPSSVRTAFRIEPPLTLPEHNADATGSTVTDYVVVASTWNSRAEGGPIISVFAGTADGEIADWAELAELRNAGVPTQRQRYELLFGLGIREIHTRARTVVVNPETGRWGAGGPGSDDYNSFL